MATAIASSPAAASVLHADLFATTLTYADIASSAARIAAAILGQGAPLPETARASIDIGAYITGERTKMFASGAMHGAGYVTPPHFA